MKHLDSKLTLMQTLTCPANQWEKVYVMHLQRICQESIASLLLVLFLLNFLTNSNFFHRHMLDQSVVAFVLASSTQVTGQLHLVGAIW